MLLDMQPRKRRRSGTGSRELISEGERKSMVGAARKADELARPWDARQPPPGRPEGR